MKLAYATTFNALDVHNWSGTPFHMSKALQAEGTSIEYIGSLKRRLPKSFKATQFWKKITCGQRESPRFNITAAKYYSEQAAAQLKQFSVDAIIAPQVNPIAYLDSDKPIVLWTDAVYSALLGFYPVFSNHSASSIEQGNIIMRECLERVRLAIFSSEWAARSAIELYGTNKDKVKVVPYGANLQSVYSLADIRALIAKRSKDTVKLLFIGKHWYRKGGDIVFAVAKKLHELGQPVELNFVGCEPPPNVSVPSFIHCHGFISKRTPEGLAKMTTLLEESHFLFLPSRAEAFGIAFCEANAFGLPALTSYVGGISSAVRDNINGMTFGLQEKPEVYCTYIMDLFSDYARYEELALSAFNEFQTRLNWKSAVIEVKRLLQETF